MTDPTRPMTRDEELTHLDATIEGLRAKRDQLLTAMPQLDPPLCPGCGQPLTTLYQLVDTEEFTSYRCDWDPHEGTWRISQGKPSNYEVRDRRSHVQCGADGCETLLPYEADCEEWIDPAVLADTSDVSEEPEPAPEEAISEELILTLIHAANVVVNNWVDGPLAKPIAVLDRTLQRLELREPEARLDPNAF